MKTRWISMWLVIMLFFLTFSTCCANKEDVKVESIEKEKFDNKSQVIPEGASETKTESKKGAMISLGEVLGFFSFICILLYCIGIGWKIFKVVKGTYVAEEPVFLKYK